MALIKLNNRSVKDATAFGSISSLGSLTFISKQTASSSATISFTSGIDSTYKEYIFYFVNMHPATDGAELQFNLSTDSGSNYNVTKTTTTFDAEHNEDDSFAGLQYLSGNDLAQSTSFQNLNLDMEGTDNDGSVSGHLHLFNPSSTTFVKHFIATTSSMHQSARIYNQFTAGYGNTTSAVDAIRFQMSSGNIDSGDIILFGLN
tara:strand:- start:130 stop:738 length:609 start_codon:yes stop_codon:yes gene_type:complete